MRKATKLAPVRSIGDLRTRAQTDYRYAKLARLSAENLGWWPWIPTMTGPTELDQCIDWLTINAQETDQDGEGEQMVVDEINFCRDCV